MYWNTYRLSYSGHVIFKVAIKKDNEAYPHINGSMKKLATRAICAGHLDPPHAEDLVAWSTSKE